MRYVEVDGLRASAIGLGTWQFGSREWGYGETYAATVAPAIVRRAFELGITFIDTAEVYGLGRSERIVGAALHGRPDDVIVATKLLPLLPLPAITAWRGRASRTRLGVDAIDLYQLHFPNPIVPPRTTMRGMRRLLDDGVIRRVGVSNHSLRGWRVAERALGRPVVTNQVRFSLASPSPRWDLVPYARDRDRVVIAYSPLAQGLLARGVDDEGRRRLGPGWRHGAAIPWRSSATDVAPGHSSRRSTTSPGHMARRPPRWRSPGSSPMATSSPSREPTRSSSSRRTRRRPTST